jgi:hypothetical protein
VGASGWSYYVPYQADLNAALVQLRDATFASGEYYWPNEFYRRLGAELEDKPRPTRLADLYADDMVQEDGTHSILDMFKVIGPGEEPDYGTVEPLSDREALEHAGTCQLTRHHVDKIESLASRRWFGRCAVLHDERGEPAEIYFWGFSGD